MNMIEYEISGNEKLSNYVDQGDEICEFLKTHSGSYFMSYQWDGIAV